MSILLLVGSCQDALEYEHTTGQVNQQAIVTKGQLAQQLTDSLRKHWYLTEFVQRDDSDRYVVYGTHNRIGKVGVVALTDSVLLLYQGSAQTAQLTNRITFPNYAYAFKEVELNGDEQPDFIVYGMYDMHGQSEPFVFINYHGKLRYRPDLKQYDLTYDAAKKLVYAHYSASGNSIASKELFRWKGDSLQQLAGAYYDLDKSLTTIFRLQQGKKIHVKSYHSAAVYDTALFQLTSNFF